MTSSDIYYRLGRIESNIEALQTDVKDLKDGQTRLEGEIADLRKENKEDLRDQRTELKGDIVEFRAENSEEHRAMRAEFKAEIESLRAEMQALRSDLITSIGIWFSLFAVIITAVSISVPLLINHFNNKKEKEKEPRSEIPHEHEPIFSLSAIKSLIDYYKTGK